MCNLCAQVHVLPRPGTAAAPRAVSEASPMFAFHHLNTFETSNGDIVLDTLASSNTDFDTGLSGTLGYSTEGSTRSGIHDAGDNLTTLRRLVLRRGAKRADEHEFRAVCPALRNRALEMPSQLPADVVAQPHSTMFFLVRFAHTRLRWCSHQDANIVSTQLLG